MEKLNIIFNELPGAGLRGDPHLWRELEEYFRDFDCSLEVSEFHKLLLQRFSEIVKAGKVYDRMLPKERGLGNFERVINKDIIYIDRYPKQGMSGGYISLKWWRECGLPTLYNRYLDLKSSEKTSQK